MTPDQQWRDKTYTYVREVNEFVERGLSLGWDHAGADPVDPGRAELASAALDAVRVANATGDFEGLRDRWPPAHLPLGEMLKDNGQPISTLAVFNDGAILARVGDSRFDEGTTVRIEGSRVTTLADFGTFGVGPNGRYFAIPAADGVHIRDGWTGPTSAICPWPIGTEGAPSGVALEAIGGPHPLESLVPFPEGDRVLLLGNAGAFVLSVGGATRLTPSEASLIGMAEGDKNQNSGAAISTHVAMGHGAVSKDGRWIAVGHQDSRHFVFDANLSLVGDIGNASDYPHYALFSADGSVVAFNSCHFYNGETIAVPLELLPGLTTEQYDVDPRTPVVEDSARVYAGVARGDELMLGDASGYVRGVSITGEVRWQHYVGSTVSAMALSPDGQTLVVATYAGYVSIIKLDAGGPLPNQIGNSPHQEVHRWLFWKNEPTPLLW